MGAPIALSESASRWGNAWRLLWHCNRCFDWLFSLARASMVPIVAVIFPIPKIALLPLFVIWFGIDEPSKYALIAFGTFTPTVVATYGAVDNVDRSLIRMGQSFSLS